MKLTVHSNLSKPRLTVKINPLPTAAETVRAVLRSRSTAQVLPSII